MLFRSNVVAVTQTLGTWGGNFYVTPGLGFLSNDKLTSYGTDPSQYGARLPFARHGSTLAPTIAFKGKKPVFAVGAAGNSWITSAVFQTLVGALDFGLDPQRALELPRFLPGGRGGAGAATGATTSAANTGAVVVTIEDGFSPEVLRRMRAMGYEFNIVSLKGELREGNGAAIGFDLGSEPVRLGTLRRAAETGRLAVTGRVNLIQFQTNSAGVLAFVPLYEGDALPPTAEARWERLRGLTLAVIRVHDLIHLSIPPDRQGDFDLLIEDPTAAASARILYDSGDTIALHADDDLKLVTTLPVGDREWSLRLYPTEAYLGRHPPRLCRALEGLSLVASCLLVSFLLVITGRGARVEQLVSERTRELERQMKLAHLASSISAAIASEGEFRPRLEECMRLIISHLDAAFARIWTLDATGGVLELQASAGLYTHINGGHARVPVGSYKIGLIASERRPHLTNEVENDPRIGDPQWARREGMKAFAGYPLLSGDRLVGVVALFARQALDDATLEALESIAEKLGLFIDRQAALIALQASEAHIRLIVDTALDGVVTVDAHGVVLGWNIQAERIFGWQASEAMGRPVSELIVPPEMRAAHLAGIEAFRRTGIGTILGKRIEVTGQRRNGDRFPMELSVNPVSTNAGTGFSAFMRDISDRKQAETRLQDAARAIEEANARLHQSLLQAEKLAEEAQAANKAKSEFLATMSHEIRTPMNGILGFVQLLSDTPLNPEQREFTGIIRQSGDALLSIIDDILDFSKVEAGKLTLNCAPFDVLPVVQEVVGLLTPKAAEKGLHLTLKLAANQPGQVVGDPARVRQVVTNLVGNAIKFTETGGVTVEMECGPPPGGDPHDSRQHLRISVLDTGIGISEEKQRLLFQKFTQLDSSTTRRFGGTGLGLAISKQLITLMNGRVGCTSAPGRGSTFWFSIPLATATAIQRNACALPPPSRAATPTSPTPPAPRLDPSAPSDALTVILAEDNSTNRALARRLVEKCGFRVETAVNGREAVEKSAADGCIAILMDCDMPEMDGFEATHAIRLRERATGGRLPIIALTANAMAGDREKCLEAGMDDYLSKPVKFPDLQATLARWVASSQPAPPLKQP